MTFDPTTNRIPFGLLSEDEQTALIHWPHGCEIWWEDKENNWGFIVEPQWKHNFVYRAKPKPVVTSVWLNVYPTGASFPYESRASADSSADPDRIAVLRNDTCNGVSTAHLENV